MVNIDEALWAQDITEISMYNLSRFGHKIDTDDREERIISRLLNTKEAEVEKILQKPKVTKREEQKLKKVFDFETGRLREAYTTPARLEDYTVTPETADKTADLSTFYKTPVVKMKDFFKNKAISDWAKGQYKIGDLEKMSGEEYAQWLVGEFDADVSGWSPQKGEKARQRTIKGKKKKIKSGEYWQKFWDNALPEWEHDVAMQTQKSTNFGVFEERKESWGNILTTIGTQAAQQGALMATAHIATAFGNLFVPHGGMVAGQQTMAIWETGSALKQYKEAVDSLNLSDTQKQQALDIAITTARQHGQVSGALEYVGNMLPFKELLNGKFGGKIVSSLFLKGLASFGIKYTGEIGEEGLQAVSFNEFSKKFKNELLGKLDLADEQRINIEELELNDDVLEVMKQSMKPLLLTSIGGEVATQSHTFRQNKQVELAKTQETPPYPKTQETLPYTKTQKALPYKTQKAPRVITRQKPPRTSDGVMRDVGSRVSLHPVPRPTAPPEARGELIRTIQNSMKTGKPFIIPPTFANGFPIKDMWWDLRDRFSDVRRGRNVEIRKEPGLVQNRTGNLINPQTGKADLPTASAVSMPMIYTGGAVPTYDSDINSLEDHVAVQVGYDTKVDFIKAIQYLQSLGKFKDDRFSVYETPAGLRIMDIGKALGEPQDPKMIDIFKQDKFYTSFTIQRYNKFLSDNGFDRQLTERAADITKLGVGAPYAARLSPKYGRKDDYVARKLFDFGGGKANPKAVDAVKKYHDNIIDIIKSEGAHINIDKLIRLIEE